MKLKLFLCFALPFLVNAAVIVNVIEDGDLVDNKLNGCIERDCNENCVNNHYTSGWCVGDQCVCNDAKADVMFNAKYTVCNDEACNKLCQYLGFPSGSCLGDKCNCHSSLVHKDILRGCNVQACDQLCRRLGFTGGVCVGDRCKCDINIMHTLKENSRNVGCNASSCDYLCRRKGYLYGRCIGNRCECRYMLKTDDDDAEKFNKLEQNIGG